MNDSNDGLIAFFVCAIVLTIVFFIGLGFGSPNYKLPVDIKTKLENDAKNNFRSEEEQIAYIINNYYCEDKK